MKTTLIFIMVFLTGLLSGCGKDDELVTLRTDSSAIARKRVGDLTFTLQILNMQDKPQAVFQEGENFQFEFIIENTGEQDYTLPTPWYFPFHEDFFTLYRMTQESGGASKIGKSFTLGGNFLDAMLAEVPGKHAAVYTMPWLVETDSVYIMPTYLPHIEGAVERYYRVADNPVAPLRPGEYFTGATVKYSETDSVRMEVSFSVE
ncbi:hypothetical protein WJR50_31310 [Catalinimonas sp. 4WD22]|uniref:hypothetical protein n=1 Tax=Catalinimonas locisalis TaxID=3133978 RepID=UPI003101261D